MTAYRVPRRVTELTLDPVSSAEAGAASATQSGPLADWRSVSAYVLLGEPGSGKTTAFEMEYDADPEGAERVSARDFAALDVESRPEWRGKTLFIDGLDEMRTASRDWRRPLDAIRKRLDALCRPRFRLSCRAGEWLGEDDAGALRRLGSYGELAVLRLEPLDEAEMRVLLEERVGRSRADDFLRAANEHDLLGFLQHPLNLDLLVEAGIEISGVTGRRGLFETACRAMVREKNPAHRAAARGTQRLPETALLNASGRLCAMSLLADALGWSADPAEPTPDHPSLREIEEADSGVVPEELDAALRTPLFRMTTPAGRFEPMHRQVAEFLAGRFLGDQVERRNVSSARLRALMAGADGAPAPSLRGLAAWVAVHSARSRPSLIRDDPIGVASYGDPTEFTTRDQQRLMSNLRERAGEIDIWEWPWAALPSLATPGALPVVHDMISAPERDDATQSLVYLALRAVAHVDGSYIPRDLRAPLFGAATDERWWPGTRAAALKAWVRNAPDDGGDLDEALRLLNAIRDGDLADPRGSLTGILLGSLYPTRVAPDALWQYARSVQPDPVGSWHLELWKYELPRRSDEDGRLAEVLDGLCRWLDGGRRSIDDYCTRDGVAKVFALALERHGDEIETERLYEWLAAYLHWMPTKGDLDRVRRIGQRFGFDAPPEEDIRSKTAAWLRDRPSTQRALILEMVRRRDDDSIVVPPESGFTADSLTLDDVLAGAPVADFAPWFLEQAVSLSESRPWLACHMLRRTGVGTSEGLTIDEVRTRISGNAPLEERLESLLAPPPQPSPQHPLALERTRKRRKWIEWVGEHADALGRGEGPPSAYHDIATAYLGINRSVRGDNPEERIRNLFLGDEQLSRVALDGLRRVALRTDLPTLDELVRLEEDGKVSYFILPLLAALEEEEHTAGEDPAPLQGDILQRALGSLFFAEGRDIADPAWYRRALRSNPDEVADAFVKVYRSRIRRSSSVDRHLHALTLDESHAEVARAALPRLLKSFPAKATADQLIHLDYLIPAALELVHLDELASIARRKLESSSLRIGHRIRWLATGMFLGDPHLGEELDLFLSDGSDARMREFAAFLRVQGLSRRVGSLSPRSLAMLVRRLGGCFAPHSGGAPHYMSHELDEALQADGLVRTALDALSRLPSPEATELFDALLDDEDLTAWRDPIAEASEIQRVVRLDAEFEAPTIRDVLRVLNDAQPASAADLAALAADRILAVREQVRDADLDLWRHFWSEGKHGKAQTPKIEPSCEQALLAALRPQLPERVRVESEVRYAGGTRADLQVSFRDFAIPIETKKSSSRDLWTAVADQLIPRYARDPRSDGYGIYVVFWHGPKHARIPAPVGRPPRTPGELEDRLTQRLTAEARRKVSVIVLDVSPP